MFDTIIDSKVHGDLWLLMLYEITNSVEGRYINTFQRWFVFLDSMYNI